jgi:hypothetical protein
VNDRPVITGHPQNQEVDEGDPVMFSVTVQDPLLVSFQWRKDGVALSDDDRFSGTTTATMCIVPVEVDDQGEYDCVVAQKLSEPCPKASETATLTVHSAAQTCPADLNGDGFIGLADLSQLLGHYGTMSGANPEDGDLDRDGDVDLSDLAEMLGVYGTFCD